LPIRIRRRHQRPGLSGLIRKLGKRTSILYEHLWLKTHIN
jgi:hypothetical protein